jgi:hypothetical protein
MLSTHLTGLLALTAFVVATTASSSLKPRADGPCLDLLYSEPQCCSMDGSDCNYCEFFSQSPFSLLPTTTDAAAASDDDDFEALKAACEGEGSRAMCCTLPSGPSVPLCREVVG